MIKILEIRSSTVLWKQQIKCQFQQHLQPIDQKHWVTVHTYISFISNDIIFHVLY